MRFVLDEKDIAHAIQAELQRKFGQFMTAPMRVLTADIVNVNGKLEAHVTCSDPAATELRPEPLSHPASK